MNSEINKKEDNLEIDDDGETDDDDDIKKNTTIFKGKCCITLE